jgi:hypothetical protein
VDLGGDGGGKMGDSGKATEEGRMR